MEATLTNPLPPPTPNPNTIAIENTHPSGPSAHPDLQLHLHITHESNLRVTLSTSLLINYPSTSFMSLPVKLSIVGLIFSGEFVVAYEGSRRRVHLCIVDDQDPASGALIGRKGDFVFHSIEKRAPVGQRLLPSIFIESEIGQADKHVLKNVSKIEKFIQDVIRKMIEDELVYPNFQTIVLGPSSSAPPS